MSLPKPDPTTNEVETSVEQLSEEWGYSEHRISIAATNVSSIAGPFGGKINATQDDLVELFQYLEAQKA